MSDCFVLYLLLTCMKKKTSGADKFTNNSWGMLDDDDDGTEYISVGEKTTYWFDVVPYQYNGTVKVTCSDPKIATVKYKKDKDGANTVVVKGLKKGTVSITVEVNGAKVTMKLKVVNPDFFE